MSRHRRSHHRSHSHAHAGEKRIQGGAVAAVVTIAVTYIYFLLFAGYSYLEWVRAAAGDEHVRVVLALLGGGGIAGSLAGGALFAPARGRWHLAGGFGLCALAAVLSLSDVSWGMIVVTALLVGGSLGWTTVTLSACLRPTAHMRHLGLWCGLGTGLAYAVCNQPAIFEAEPRAQIIVAAVAAGIGTVAALRMRGEPLKRSDATDYTPIGASFWILIFLALVALDSACFAAIQQNPTLREGSWEGVLALQGNAFLHLCVASLAGLALDRRIPAPTVLLGATLLVGSGWLLNAHTRFFPQARVLYVAAVSIYSTVLVFFPARSGRPWLAALVFAISGWIGSSFGLAVMQGAEKLPLWCVITAGSVVAVSMLLRLVWLKQWAHLRDESARAIESPTERS